MDDRLEKLFDERLNYWDSQIADYGDSEALACYRECMKLYHMVRKTLENKSN